MPTLHAKDRATARSFALRCVSCSVLIYELLLKMAEVSTDEAQSLALLAVFEPNEERPHLR